MSARVPGTWERGEPPPCLTYQLPKPFRDRWLATGALVCKAYTMGACHIMLAREPQGPQGELLWHLSISCEDRHPTWDEIKAARYRLLPLNLVFAVLLPPPGMYINVPQQDHVFHLWEVYDPREPWAGG